MYLPRVTSARSLPAALLLDADGTLAETERDGHRVAFNMAFRDCGLDWDWDEALYGRLLMVSGGLARMRAYGRDMGEPLDDEILAALHRSKAAHYRALVAGGAVPVRPGVRRLVAEARDAGVRLALVTDSTEESVATLLGALLPELGSALEVAVHGGMLGRRKPDPEGYLLALSRLGLPAGRCLAVEDSAKGALAARTAGLPTLVAVSSTAQGEDLSCATAVVSSLGDETEAARVLWGPPCPGARIDLAWCGMLTDPA